MKFTQDFEPELRKPIVIAAMQDMGNVGSIVTDYICEKLNARRFRTAKTSLTGYVIDNCGHIDVAQEEWGYACTDSLIVFGGGAGQPQDTAELHEICRDVIDTAKKHSASIIYTAGGLHTDRDTQNAPGTYVTATSQRLARQLAGSGFNLSRQRTMITGFNGLILGYAKSSRIRAIGMYGELNDPSIPQYRAAKSVIETFQRLTYLKIGDTADLERLAEDVDEKVARRWRPSFQQ